MTLFGHKWPYSAIGSPSDHKWLEHWFNMVEHCSMWNMMFNHVQLMPNPLGVAENAYGQILQFWAKKGRFWALLGPKKTFLGVPNGHNWPPRMWDMMFTHVQPMFNQFGVPGTTYGHLWPFLAKKNHFWGVLGPLNAIFWVQKGPNSPPQMWSTMFNQVQPMPNPFGVAGTAYGQIWQFWAKIAIKSP